MNGRERLSVGLLRAAALARMSGGRLFVACAVAPRLRHNMLFPHRSAAEMAGLPSAHAGAGQRLRAFCDAVLMTRLPDDQLFVREGGVAAVAAAVADEIGAAAVVLGAAGDGKTATEVACRAGVPVLVARRVRMGAIVAATDLSDPRFPVLRQAGELAEWLDERATVVHNVPSAPALSLQGAGFDMGVGFVSQEEIMSEYRRRLRALTRSLSITADPVVLSRASTAEAILEVAREGDADLLVVGTHARSWFGRLFSPSTAEVVVDRTERSVLVLPLSEDEADEALGAPTAWAA